MALGVVVLIPGRVDQRVVVVVEVSVLLIGLPSRSFDSLKNAVSGDAVTERAPMNVS